MTKRNLAVQKTRAKRRAETPLPEGKVERAARRAGISVAEARRPTPFQLTHGHLFDGEEGINEATTAADLFVAQWEALNRCGIGSTAEAFSADVLLGVADEMAIVESALSSSTVNSGALARHLLRSEWRIKSALEVSRRMKLEAAEVGS